MLICVISVALMRNLFASVMLLSIYSLLAACLFVIMDAVDVAFTEAAVGAGISTILMLATLLYVGQECQQSLKIKWAPLLLSLSVGALLLYGTVDIPPYGKQSNPIHQYKVSKHYLEKGQAETNSPNIVTSILASYRGYDTLGEVTVVFCAGIGVLLLLSGFKRKTPKYKNKNDKNKNDKNKDHENINETDNKKEAEEVKKKS